MYRDFLLYASPVCAVLRGLKVADRRVVMSLEPHQKGLQTPCLPCGFMLQSRLIIRQV